MSVETNDEVMGDRDVTQQAQTSPARRRLTRAESRERTRQRLLEATATVIAQRGFAGATVEEISETAGYSTGAFYSNFEDKAAVFLELASARGSRGVARRVAELTGLLENELDDGKLFDALNGFLVQLADRNREFAPLQAEFWLYAVRNPEAMAIIAERLGEQTTAVERLMAPLLERAGAPSALSAREVTTVVAAMLQGLVRQRRIDRASVPDDLFGRALRWLLEGLRSEVAAPSRPKRSTGAGGRL